MLARDITRRLADTPTGATTPDRTTPCDLPSGRSGKETNII